MKNLSDEKDFKEALLQAFDNFEQSHDLSVSFYEMLQKFKSSLSKDQLKELEMILTKIQDSHHKTKKRIIAFVVDFFFVSEKYQDVINSSKKDKSQAKWPCSINPD